MAGITLACPKCQAPLKLKDRSLLGKKGKCPKCTHRFLLQEPATDPDVTFEVVDTPQPQVGKNATWIPDGSTDAAGSAAAATGNDAGAKSAQSPQPDNPLADLFGQSEPAAAQKVPESTSLPGLLSGDSSTTDASSSSATTPNAGAADPLSFLSGESPATGSENDLASLGSSTDSPAVTPTRKRKKRRRSSGSGMIAGIVLLLAVGVGGYLYYQSTLPPTAQVAQTDSTPATEPQGKPAGSETDPEKPAAAATGRPQGAGSYNAVKALSPTSGKPIQLYNMPAGVRLVVHLHPQTLWQDDRQFAELRASLGPLGGWLESQIQQITKQAPQAIDELLIGLILGPKGTEPELAAVVHFAAPQQRADLLKTYQGTAYEEFNPNIKIDGETAYHIVDEQTVAICPKIYVDDLKTFETMPAMTSDDLQDTLAATDRERLLTIVFDPRDIEQHADMLLPAQADLALRKTLNWLGDDVTTVAWSLNLEEDFFSELIVRGRNDVGPMSLSKRYEERLNVLPEIVLTAVQKMNPQRSGYRKLIGRFPAMMKVVSLAASVAVDGRFVRLGTLLPAKAGPNLTLGTLLTWDESTRTNFAAQAVAVAAPPKKQSLADMPFETRLQHKFDVDFRRTPLQEAFAFIADEAKIPIEVDGDALKLAGFTKNMPQTFEQTQATTLQAIYGIVKRYENEAIPLAIVLDKKAGAITVLTVKVAADRKLETYNFKANGF